MSTSTIVLLIIAALAVMLIVIYNRLVALKQTRNNAFSDIDVQLRLRYDLVPNLVETVKGYAAHESELFQKVTEARASAMNAAGKGMGERSAAESAFGGALMNLMAVAENYPELKANEYFMGLQRELSNIENKIAAARRFFNNATNEYNTSVQQFPANLIAGRFGFTEEDFFEISEAEREQVEAAPSVSFN